MSEERKDDVKELYDRCNKIENIIKLFFVLNIVITFILLLDIKIVVIRDFLVIASIIFSIIYVFLSYINEMHFINFAENERRKNLLKESFNVNLTLKDTNKYYNNDIIPSIEKLGMNSYESIFHTKKIVDKMILKKFLFICVIIVFYIIVMIKVENMDLLLIITQTLFSSEIIFAFIKLCYFKFELDKLNDDFQRIFFLMPLNNKETHALILDIAMNYESLKSYCKILISTKIFFKYREQWEKEWKKIVDDVKERFNKEKSSTDK